MNETYMRALGKRALATGMPLVEGLLNGNYGVRIRSLEPLDFDKHSWPDLRDPLTLAWLNWHTIKVLGLTGFVNVNLFQDKSGRWHLWADHPTSTSVEFDAVAEAEVLIMFLEYIRSIQ